MERTATATWEGTLREGTGRVSAQSGALKELAVTFPSRFEQGKGSNPEELIAAAHACCYSMALSHILAGKGFRPRAITTSARVTLAAEGEGFAITRIHLSTEGSVDGVTEQDFLDAANEAKTGCPVSKLLAPGLRSLTLEARLKR